MGGTPTYYLVCQKPHESEKNWTGGHALLAPSGSTSAFSGLALKLLAKMAGALAFNEAYGSKSVNASVNSSLAAVNFHFSVSAFF